MSDWNIDIPVAEYFDRDTPGLDKLIREVIAAPKVALDTETTGLRKWKDVPLFWSMSWGGRRRVTLHASVMPLFREAFEDQKKYWYFANAKFDLHMVANYGCPIKGHVVDIQVMHALLHDDRPHALKSIAEEVKGWRWSDFKDTFKKTKDQTYQDAMMAMFHNDRQRLVEYACNDAYATMEIGEELDKLLYREHTWSMYPSIYPTLGEVFWKTEMPFTRVLWKMERRGILLDQERAAKSREPIEKRMVEIEKRVAQLKGASFNLGSRTDMMRALLEEEGLRPLGYTKGGKSGKRSPKMDEEFYMAYRGQSELAGLKYEYESIRKVKSTFIDGLIAEADNDSRIHTSFTQDTARTGRLSSKEPALQVIPNADNDDYKLREMFVSAPGMSLICRDYNALEMRLLACGSREPSMVDIFRRGWDIHMGNAAMVFGVEYDDIAAAKKKKDNKQPLSELEKQLIRYRGDIKAVGFGLNYGMREKTLAANLGCSVEHALGVTDKYMARYPAVQQFFEMSVDTARRSGHAYSLLGRRRKLPNIHSHLEHLRHQAERQATNMEIQGTAADVVRMAMLALDDANLEYHFGAHMELQVHDELVFEVPDETAVEADRAIAEIMEHPLWSELDVELKTAGSIAKNWYEAK